MEDMGFSTEALLLSATDIKTVEQSPGKVLGTLFVKISSNNSNSK